jgi:hypothetical protein
VPSWGAPVSPNVFDGANHYIGDVQATIDFGFDGIKLDGCGEFRNLSFFAQQFNKTGVPVMIENCHWGNDGPDDGCSCFPCVLQIRAPMSCISAISYVLSTGWEGCPFHFFRTSGDISKSWNR